MKPNVLQKAAFNKDDLNGIPNAQPTPDQKKLAKKLVNKLVIATKEAKPA